MLSAQNTSSDLKIEIIADMHMNTCKHVNLDLCGRAVPLSGKHKSRYKCKKWTSKVDLDLIAEKGCKQNAKKCHSIFIAKIKLQKMQIQVYS